jgi:hypothetical protein
MQTNNQLPEIVNSIRTNRLLNQVAIQTICTGWAFSNSQNEIIADHLESLADIILCELKHIRQVPVNATDEQNDEFYLTVNRALDHFPYYAFNKHDGITYCYLLAIPCSFPKSLEAYILERYTEYRLYNQNPNNTFPNWLYYQIEAYLMSSTDFTVFPDLLKFKNRLQNYITL